MTQDQALSILKTGANVFLTGEPGSGKSHTVNRYVDYLRSCGIEPAVTASTGIAATHIGGMTIHAWSGIGVKSNITEEDIDLISQKERVVRRILGAHVLIIDEISMLSAETLSSVEAVCRTLRRNERSFGGLQIVVVGDFFQLPPVEKRNFQEEQYLDERPQSVTPFAFRSRAWQKANLIPCYLSEQHRQEDRIYLDALASLRCGEVTSEVKACLKGRCIAPSERETITRLYPHNADVDRLNYAELEKLPGTSRLFRMTESGAPPLVEGLKRSCLSPESLALKVGAKVMFTKNSMDGAFVNGTTGDLVEFSRTSGNPLIKTRSGKLIEATALEWAISDNGRVLASVSQVPLRLAWAITVHKSQGMSLDAAVIDLRTAFEYGQGYVALSRVRTLQGLYLLGFNDRALEVHPDVSEQDGAFRDQSDEAREAFTKMSTGELETLHENFIRAGGGSPGKGRQSQKKDKSTHDATEELVRQGLGLADIAKERGMTVGTILAHLEKLVSEEKLQAEDISHLKPEEERYQRMETAFKKVYAKEKKLALSPVHRALKSAFAFDELRLARLFLKDLSEK
jgi:ATP-dependent DNA helicase PIF1